MRRPRRRSRLIRSTTSGVTFKSPPRRRLGVLYRRISAPEPQSYRLLDSVGRYVEPGQGVVSDERLATYLNQGKIRHVDTSQHGSGDRRVVCRPNPRARLKLLKLPSVESSADAGSRWLRCPGESASLLRRAPQASLLRRSTKVGAVEVSDISDYDRDGGDPRCMHGPATTLASRRADAAFLCTPGAGLRVAPFVLTTSWSRSGARPCVFQASQAPLHHRPRSRISESL
jgi:hypothetical protein